MSSGFTDPNILINKKHPYSEDGLNSVNKKQKNNTTLCYSQKTSCKHCVINSILDVSISAEQISSFIENLDAEIIQLNNFDFNKIEADKWNTLINSLNNSKTISNICFLDCNFDLTRSTALSKLSNCSSLSIHGGALHSFEFIPQLIKNSTKLTNLSFLETQNSLENYLEMILVINEESESFYANRLLNNLEKCKMTFSLLSSETNQYKESIDLVDELFLHNKQMKHFFTKPDVQTYNNPKITSYNPIENGIKNIQTISIGNNDLKKIEEKTKSKKITPCYFLETLNKSATIHSLGDVPISANQISNLIEDLNAEFIQFRDFNFNAVSEEDLLKIITKLKDSKKIKNISFFRCQFDNAHSLLLSNLSHCDSLTFHGGSLQFEFIPELLKNSTKLKYFESRETQNSLENYLGMMLAIGEENEKIYLHRSSNELEKCRMKFTLLSKNENQYKESIAMADEFFGLSERFLTKPEINTYEISSIENFMVGESVEKANLINEYNNIPNAENPSIAYHKFLNKYFDFIKCKSLEELITKVLNEFQQNANFEDDTVKAFKETKPNLIQKLDYYAKLLAKKFVPMEIHLIDRHFDTSTAPSIENGEFRAHPSRVFGFDSYESHFFVFRDIEEIKSKNDKDNKGKEKRKLKHNLSLLIPKKNAFVITPHNVHTSLEQLDDESDSDSDQENAPPIDSKQNSTSQIDAFENLNVGLLAEIQKKSFFRTLKNSQTFSNFENIIIQELSNFVSLEDYQNLKSKLLDKTLSNEEVLQEFKTLINCIKENSQEEFNLLYYPNLVPMSETLNAQFNFAISYDKSPTVSSQVFFQAIQKIMWRDLFTGFLERFFFIENVPGDHNCLFTSIERSFPEIFPPSTLRKETAQYLRTYWMGFLNKIEADYLPSNSQTTTEETEYTDENLHKLIREEERKTHSSLEDQMESEAKITAYKEFLTIPLENRNTLKQQFMQYCDNIEKTLRWGGDLELSVFPNLIKKKNPLNDFEIHIFDSNYLETMTIENDKLITNDNLIYGREQGKEKQKIYLIRSGHGDAQHFDLLKTEKPPQIQKAEHLSNQEKLEKKSPIPFSDIRERPLSDYALFIQATEIDGTPLQVITDREPK